VHGCGVENGLARYGFKFAGNAARFFFYEEWRIAFWADSNREKFLFERCVYLVVGPHGLAFETMTDRGDHPRFNLNVTFRAENVEGSVLVSFHLQPISAYACSNLSGKRPHEAGTAWRPFVGAASKILPICNLAASHMTNIRLPKAVCVVVAEVLRPRSHAIGDSLFLTAGAPGPPPDLPHTDKWKDWLFRAGADPNVDSLSLLGNVLEEFMDVRPKDSQDFAEWKANRDRVVQVLEENGFRYYRGGRVLPTGQIPEIQPVPVISGQHGPTKPAKIDELLEILIKGLRRAMYPLTQRRKGAQTLSFSTEYDVQDLLHALLRPWVLDIRPEEFTPSYAGSSTRMDFLLPKYKIVLELKFVRDSDHAKKIGNELIEDIDHYQRHPDCKDLWCVVFDPDHLLPNPEGLKNDLDGNRTSKVGSVHVRVFVLYG
jgi:REase_DpnII-MboI